MRRGEVLGLRWPDIDFKKNLIAIRQQAKIDPLAEKDKLILGSLKTDSSYRTIPIGHGLVVILKQQKIQRAREKMTLGDAYSDNKLVFAKADGNIVPPNTLGTWFDRLMDKIAMPKRNFHQLRHTFVSVAISQGQNIKAISAVIGHSKISTTLDEYGHLLPGDAEGVVQAVAEYYSL